MKPQFWIKSKVPSALEQKRTYLEKKMQGVEIIPVYYTKTQNHNMMKHIKPKKKKS